MPPSTARYHPDRARCAVGPPDPACSHAAQHCAVSSRPPLRAVGPPGPACSRTARTCANCRTATSPYAVVLPSPARHRHARPYAPSSRKACAPSSRQALHAIVPPGPACHRPAQPCALLSRQAMPATACLPCLRRRRCRRCGTPPAKTWQPGT
eukprot:365521-Chlamydomonas_euryale.AAC.8